MVSGINEFAYLSYATAGVHEDKFLPIQTFGIWSSRARPSKDSKEPPNTTEYYLSGEPYEDVIIGTDGPCEYQ